jgi:hypothetical protein
MVPRCSNTYMRCSGAMFRRARAVCPSPGQNCFLTPGWGAAEYRLPMSAFTSCNVTRFRASRATCCFGVEALTRTVGLWFVVCGYV